MSVVQDYKGVNAPTRKAVEEVSRDAYSRYLKGETIVIPNWMRIQDTDTEKQREKKQRALKSLKKRIRYDPQVPTIAHPLLA